MKLTTDLSRVSPEVRRAVLRGIQLEDRAQYVIGTLNQRRMRRLVDQAMAPGVNRDAGRLDCVIDQDQAARCRSLYGELCFMDPEFVPWLLKNNDEMRVPDKRTSISVGWTPELRHG